MGREHDGTNKERHVGRQGAQHEIIRREIVGTL
jgi:hypothetical protein